MINAHQKHPAVLSSNPQSSLTVCSIIVNYSSFEDSIRCCRGLLALNSANLEIVLLDNASPDGSGAALRRILEPLGVTCILIPENKGFAAANNVGIHYCLSRNPEFIWLLNADTSIKDNTLQALLDAASQYPEAGAFGSKVLYGQPAEASGKEIIWSAGAKIDFRKQSLEMCAADEEDRGQCDTSYECDYLPGCAMFIRSSVVREIGYLPEDYFMYFEETEWCTRMQRRGFHLRYVPSSIVRHHFATQKMQEPFGVYYFNRNARLFWFRFGTPLQRFRLIADTLFRALPSSVYALYKAPDSHLQKIFFAHTASCLDFLCRRFGKRSYFQK